MTRNYTNQELAGHYFTVVTQNANDTLTYRTMRELIESCPVNISEHYNTNKKFPAVEGVGDETERILRLILDEGPLTAEKRTRIERENADRAESLTETVRMERKSRLNRLDKLTEEE